MLTNALRSVCARVIPGTQKITLLDTKFEYQVNIDTERCCAVHSEVSQLMARGQWLGIG